MYTILTKESEAVGKTVESVNIDEHGVVFFTDGTCLVIGSGEYGEQYAGIELKGELDIHDSRSQDIITEKEYQAARKKEKRDRNKKIKKQELERLAVLKAKYEGNDDT